MHMHAKHEVQPFGKPNIPGQFQAFGMSDTSLLTFRVLMQVRLAFHWVADRLHPAAVTMGAF